MGTTPQLIFEMYRQVWRHLLLLLHPLLLKTLLSSPLRCRLPTMLSANPIVCPARACIAFSSSFGLHTAM